MNRPPASGDLPEIGCDHVGGPVTGLQVEHEGGHYRGRNKPVSQVATGVAEGTDLEDRGVSASSYDLGMVAEGIVECDPGHRDAPSSPG